MRDGRYKWYDGRLFDLKADPGETVDVHDRAPGEAARLEAAYRAGLPGDEAGSAADEKVVELPTKTREQLRQLGYLQ